MNIVAAQRNITEFHIALSEADAREAVESPYVFADKLAEQLRAAGVVPTTNGGGNGHKPKLESHIQVGRGRKATKASLRKAAKTAGAARPNGKEGVKCPQCGKTLQTQGFLDRHLRQKHGQASPASAAALSSME